MARYSTSVQFGIKHLPLSISSIRWLGILSLGGKMLYMSIKQTYKYMKIQAKESKKSGKKEKKTVYITRNALFRDFSMIMCNNITEVDESFIEDNFELFYIDCEVCEGRGEKENKSCDECCGGGQHTLEAYQYFIINANKYELARLKEYGVRVGHSNLLDLDIMPIYDFGTSWSAFSYSKEVDADYQLSHDETLKRETVY